MVLSVVQISITGVRLNTLTLKIPQTLVDALQIASTRRKISKSAVVRDALERTLTVELKQLAPATAWLERWRGALSAPTLDVSGVSPDRRDLSAVSPAPPDSRLAHILAKHMH